MAGKSRGRQKIKMTRMSKESNLLVTFSKRRSGLFKKANELCTLCGVELAIIVFSPGKKVFCFGHPCVFTLINRFLNNSPLPNSSAATSGTSQLVEAHRKASVNELNMQLMEMNEQIELEKKRGDELNKIRKASEKRCWWEKPVNELSLQELEQLKEAMEELKKNVTKQAESIMAAAGNFVGGSSSSSSMMSRGTGGGHFGHSTAAASSSAAVDHGKVPTGLGLSMNPHGYSLGFDRAFF